MSGRKHRLPLGTKVVFEGDSYIYETADYQTVLECSPDCEDDHDHWPEPHICVSQTTKLSMPLSKLVAIFSEGNIGRDPTPEERNIDE